MKRFLPAIAAIATILSALDASAATATVPNGSISIVYADAAGAIVYSPYVSINDATFASFLTWCKARYVSTAAASTSLGCFNTWANDGFNQTIAGMTAAAQQAAAAAAAAAVTPPAIVPAQ